MTLMTFRGRPMTERVLPGAGLIKTAPEADYMARQPGAGAVVLGSITIPKRDGNNGTNYATTERGTLNSRGIPNGGAEFYRIELPKAAEAVHAQGKPFIVSIAGFSSEEFAILARLAFESGADGIEINLSCPNTRNASGERDPIPSYVPALAKHTIRSVLGAVDPKEVSVGVKVSPCTNLADLDDLAIVIRHVGSLAFVTVMNTIPNGCEFDASGNYALTVTDGFGGISGPALRPFTIGQIRLWNTALKGEIPIIGMGGVMEKADVEMFLKAGASAVGATTLLFEGGFESINDLVS